MILVGSDLYPASLEQYFLTRKDQNKIRTEAVKNGIFEQDLKKPADFSAGFNHPVYHENSNWKIILLLQGEVRYL